MSILDDILARLDHLEGLTSIAGEATQANYLTLDPATGLVGASFTGIVHALGLTLSTPDEIDWTRPSDGQIVAAIHALDVAAGTQQDLIATAQAVAPGNLAFSRYGSTDSAGAFSGIIAEQIAAGPTSLDQVNMQVNGGVAKTLLDGAGQSEFLQLQTGLQTLKVSVGATGFVAVAATGWQKIVTALDTGFRNLCRLGITPISGSGALVGGHVAIGTGTTGIYDLWGNVTQAGQVSFDWHAFGN